MPFIRKHGAYITPQKIKDIIANPDNMIKLLQALKEEQQKRKQLEQKIEEEKPYVTYAKQVELCENALQIGEWVKSISRTYDVIISRNKAFKWLRQNGYLNTKNVPYQSWINLGYVEYYVRPVTLDNEVKIEAGTTYITPKGQIALTEKIVEYFRKEV